MNVLLRDPSVGMKGIVTEDRIRVMFRVVLGVRVRLSVSVRVKKKTAI
jgi:hypothetical protein